MAEPSFMAAKPDRLVAAHRSSDSGRRRAGAVRGDGLGRTKAAPGLPQNVLTEGRTTSHGRCERSLRSTTNFQTFGNSTGRLRQCCLIHKTSYDRCLQTPWTKTAASFSMQDPTEHFAYCVQLFGGTTAASRRLGIDERAIRRFINGERPVGAGLLEDTAKALRLLVVEATAAEGKIAATLRAEPNNP